MRSIAVAIAVVLTTGGLALAEPPGHEMEERGSKHEPGASGYAPGHEMQDRGSKGDKPGASGYAPGHEKDSHSRS